MSAPAVAVSPDGKKFAAAWKDVRTGRNDPHVYWSISESPNFTEDSAIDFVAHTKQDHPTVTIDSSGTVWAVWEDTRSGRQRIWSRSSADGDPGGPISEQHEGEASFPVVASNAGLVAVVYEVANHGKSAVVFRLIETGQN
jgi:hypothetical protein